MNATEIRNFLLTRPGVEAMRGLLATEGVALPQGVRLGSKALLEGLILDLMVERG